MKLLTNDEKKELANKFGFEYQAVAAVMAVESSGRGYDASTGKVLIQFEPYWFKYYSGIAIANGVENQAKEWEAFNNAWAKNPNAAMMATSWGLGQIMGFNFKAAGYRSVDDMVTAFRESEYNQLHGMLMMISANHKLKKAMQDKDWRTFAYYYNGPQYLKFKYDTRLASAYQNAAA